MTVYLNIGSNQGDRHAMIRQAVALIASAFPQARLRVSHYYESEPWGYNSPHPFINLGVALDNAQCMENTQCFENGAGVESAEDTIEVRGLALLDMLQGIERKISNAPHRNTDGSYRDRLIDIDIIAIDTLTIDTERLKVPHPRAALRPFVMKPLKELAPEEVIGFILAAVPPGEGKTRH